MGPELNFNQGHLRPEEDSRPEPIPEPFLPEGITLANKTKCSPHSTPRLHFKTIPPKNSDNRPLYIVTGCELNFPGKDCIWPRPIPSRTAPPHQHDRSEKKCRSGNFYAVVEHNSHPGQDLQLRKDWLPR